MRPHRRGMTLLEVLVAIAVVVVMAAVSVQTLANAIELKGLLAERDATTHAARVVLGKLRRELQLAFLTRHPQASLNYQTVFVGVDDNPDRLYLTSLSHQRLYRNSRESDQTELTLWAEPAREGRGYVLYHREAPRIDEEPDEDGVVLPLAHDVRSFNLRYLDPRTNEWVDEWDTRAADTANRLPRAVELGLVLIGTDPADPDRTVDLPFLTTVMLAYGPPLQRRPR